MYLIIQCRHCHHWLYVRATQQSVTCRNQINDRLGNRECGKRTAVEGRTIYARAESPAMCAEWIRLKRGSAQPPEEFSTRARP